MGLLLASRRLHRTPLCPSLISGPNYKNPSLLCKGCNGINNTISRWASHDGKGKGLPPSYQVISKVLSAPDVI